jgi:hypothetical protein
MNVNPEIDHDAFLLYHVENPSGVLDAYRVIGVDKNDTLFLPEEECQNGNIIRAWFLGYADSLKFN